MSKLTQEEIKLKILSLLDKLTEDRKLSLGAKYGELNINDKGEITHGNNYQLIAGIKKPSKKEIVSILNNFILYEEEKQNRPKSPYKGAKVENVIDEINSFFS